MVLYPISFSGQIAEKTPQMGRTVRHPNDDGVYTKNENGFLPQDDRDIIMAAAMEADLTNARIVSPSYRQVTIPYIRPTIQSATPATNNRVASYLRNPLRARGLETLSVDVTSGTGGQALAGLWLRKQFAPAPQGMEYTLRGVSTTSSVALTWTSISVTWDDTLPSGSYAVTGLEIIGATTCFGRLNFNNSLDRPGCSGMPNVAANAPSVFRHGELGQWGIFRSTAMPTVEILNTSAVSSYTVFMDIVRVA